MRKLLFITGTRADYGKLKALMQAVEQSDEYELYIYVSGMHLLEKFGNTYLEVIKDGYRNIQVAFGQHVSTNMSYNVGNVICDLTGYVERVCPDMIVVHGDRIDALAGAVVGALNNIRVAHIEGGEVSGTIDESIRHAVSKLAHYHFVANQESGQRLEQMGEERENIFVIGSPDIDIMMSDGLPTLEEAKTRYDIPFDKYGVLMYHPVTTEFHETGRRIKTVVDAVLASGRQYIVIYPNNDLGSEIIMSEYVRLEESDRFRIFPSIRFEYFLTFLKYADFMLGNSSAGVRETGIYGVPSIDVGSRQEGRYNIGISRNIQHIEEDSGQLLEALGKIDQYRLTSANYGAGSSTTQFMQVLADEGLWVRKLQKRFHSLNEMY